MVKPLVCFWSSPYFPGRFLFPKEQSGMDPKSVFSHDIFSLLNSLYKMLDLCTFGAGSRLGPFGGCFFTGGWPTGKKMNHQIMDRRAMLKYQAIHGKIFGLFLEFPILPRKISFPKRTKRHGSQISIFTWYFSLLNSLYKMLDLCTFGAESRFGPFGGCFLTGGWPTGKKMNHQIMDRWAMLKYQAIHGKTFGLFLEFPILPRKISFPKRTKRHGSQISIFTWYFFFIKLFI